jgi:hypothetical protein
MASHKHIIKKRQTTGDVLKKSSWMWLLSSLVARYSVKVFSTNTIPPPEVKIQMSAS